MQPTPSITRTAQGERPALPRSAHAARNCLLLGLYFMAVFNVHATTSLADQPLFTNTAVPGNLALALSVEFPTAVSVAHTDGNYSSNAVYLGYFDPAKCYGYAHSATESARHFFPAGLATARTCPGTGDNRWSGNFLNWATMQTIDSFRWVLTGGYRSTDSADTTYIEKAWASGQGGTSNFANRTLGAGEIGNATPFTTSLKMRIQGLGNKMRFSTGSGDVNGTQTIYDPAAVLDSAKSYEVSVRVKVCDPAAGAGGLEANCAQYPSGHYKPTGLIHKYAEKIRFSAFGYLADDSSGGGSLNRDGGVLRARQKFVGPLVTNPGSASTPNTAQEWDPSTGIFYGNPDSTDASATATEFGVTVPNSGVVNYLNKFGLYGGSYKYYDPVGELYYATLRYFKAQGNVSAWSSMGGANTATRNKWADGFPVITTWNDPLQYSCQKNFVLGIGDVNAHADRNLPGASGSSEPSKPPEVAADVSVDSVLATNRVGLLEGFGASFGTTSPPCCTNNGYLMAGLAYDANTKDIRPDDVSKPQTEGKQTVQTYWLDVLEYSNYRPNNQFYLATKYGGFKVPTGFDMYTQTAALDDASWWTTADMVGGQKRPDNYFTASRPDQVVDGLTKAFANIAAALQAFTTSFSTALPQVSLAGNASFAAKYDSEFWTGEIAASRLSFDAVTGAPTQTAEWSFAAKLATQLAGTGWDGNRRVVTFHTGTGLGVPFRHSSIANAQQLALDPPYRSGDDSADYLNYLRGQRLHEQGSADSASSKKYRARAGLLGDVVGSKARVVGPPSLPFSNASNPGYGTFKSSWSARPTVVYVGANDGMLHAIKGKLEDADTGTEMFAYVPSALFAGPNGTPAVDGLAALGNPVFAHHNYVNATPTSFDIDFGRTQGGTGTDWRSVLIGGLGKGGRSYFALDITNPAAMTTEAAAASKVLWEFTDPDMGYTFGEPTVVKTAKHGWVVLLTSGYNNTDGRGYIFVVNPRTGALLEKVSTGEGTPANSAGLAHLNAFVLDRTDGVADAAYAGDLLGNVWRLDLTTTGAYAAPTKLAVLTNGGGQALAVTTRPLIEVDPKSNRRFVLVGSGRMLNTPDIASTTQQGFFAIVDGKSTRYGIAADLPPGVSLPIGRDKLADNTNLTDTVSYDGASQIGWYIDFGTGNGGIGWRMVSDPSSAFGIVAFATTLPNGDACKPSGTSRIYAVSLGTGESVLMNSGDVLINYSTAIPSVVTDLRFFTVDGVPRLYGGGSNGELDTIRGRFNKLGTIQRLNWRELPGQP